MKRILFLLSFILLSHSFLFGQSEIWGTKSFGGKYNGGVLFNVDRQTKQINIQHRFKSLHKKNNGVGMVYIDTLNCFIGSTGDELFRYTPATGAIKTTNHRINLHGNFFYAQNGKCYVFCNSITYGNEGLYTIDPISLEYSSRSLGYGNVYTNLQFTPISDTAVSFESDSRIFHLDLLKDSIYPKHYITYSSLFTNIGQFLKYNNRYYGLKTGYTYGEQSSLYLYSLDMELGDIRTEVAIAFDTLDQGYLQNWLAGFVLGNNNKMYGAGKIIEGDERYFMFSFDPATMLFDTLSALPSEYNSAILGSFILADNGKIYNTIRSEEPGVSAIFSYSIELDNIEIIDVFDETANFEPVANLIMGPKRKLYGMQTIQSNGLIRQIYCFDPDTEELIVEKEFPKEASPLDGFSPGDFVQMGDESIIGLTLSYFHLYKFIPSTKEYSILVDFANDFQDRVFSVQLFKHDSERVLLFVKFRDDQNNYFQKSFIYNIQSHEYEFESESMSAGSWLRESENTFFRNNTTSRHFERYSMVSNDITELFSYPDSISYSRFIATDEYQFMYQKSTEYTRIYDINKLNSQSMEESHLFNLNRFARDGEDFYIKMGFDFIYVDSNTLVGDIYEKDGPSTHRRIVQIKLDSINLQSILEYSSSYASMYSFIHDKQNNEIYALSARKQNVTAGYFYQLDFENDSMILLDEIETTTYPFLWGEYANDIRHLKEFEKKQDICYWDGEKDSSWFEPLNWKNNQLPTDTAIVHIDENRPYHPVIDTFVRCKDLVVGRFSTLTINSKGSLTVDSYFSNKGKMKLYANEDSKASFICNGSHNQIGYQKYEFRADSVLNDVFSSPVYQTRRTQIPEMQIKEFNTNDNIWEEFIFYPFFSETTEPYWYQSNDSILSFVGDLNLSDIQLQTSATKNGICHFSNPYPSSINLSKLNLSHLQHQALYRYCPEADLYAAYIDGIGEVDLLLDPLASFCIYSEGFENIDLTAEHRIHKIHYLGDTLNKKTALSIQVSSGERSNKALISFNKNATANYDGQYDAIKLMNGDAIGPFIFTKASGRKLQINQLPDTAMMNLFVEAKKGGEYTINVGNHEGCDFLVLEDLIWGKRIDLLKENYTFDYFTTDVDYPFKLYFSQWGMEPVTEDDIYIYYYPESIVVRSKKQIEQANIIFYDLAGRKVLEFEEQDFHYFEKPIQLPGGHYIVQLRTKDVVVSTKVLVRN